MLLGLFFVNVLLIPDEVYRQAIERNKKSGEMEARSGTIWWEKISKNSKDE